MNRRMWVNENKQQSAKKFYLEMEQHELKAVWKFNQHPPWTARTHWHAEVSSRTACDLDCPQFCSMSSTPSAMPSATTRRVHGVFSTDAHQSDGNCPKPQLYVPRTLKPICHFKTHVQVLFLPLVVLPQLLSVCACFRNVLKLAVMLPKAVRSL